MLSMGRGGGPKMLPASGLAKGGGNGGRKGGRRTAPDAWPNSRSRRRKSTPCAANTSSPPAASARKDTEAANFSNRSTSRLAKKSENPLRKFQAFKPPMHSTVSKTADNSKSAWVWARRIRMGSLLGHAIAGTLW